jgi:hypothetical protein
MSEEQAAMGFTDPPYNVTIEGHASGLGGNRWNGDPDTKPDEQLAGKDRQVALKVLGLAPWSRLFRGSGLHITEIPPF